MSCCSNRRDFLTWLKVTPKQCRPKVNNFDLPLKINKYIAHRQVEVNNSLTMYIFKSPDDLFSQISQINQSMSFIFDISYTLEIESFKILHFDFHHIFFSIKIVIVVFGDVRMYQHAVYSCFMKGIFHSKAIINYDL